MNLFKCLNNHCVYAPVHVRVSALKCCARIYLAYIYMHALYAWLNSQLTPVPNDQNDRYE